jgi:hypothetical protein
LSSALDGGEWLASRPGHFTPRERALGTHWIGGWMGPRAILDMVVKRKIIVVILTVIIVIIPKQDSHPHMSMNIHTQRL